MMNDNLLKQRGNHSSTFFPKKIPNIITKLGGSFCFNEIQHVHTHHLNSIVWLDLVAR